MNRRGTNERLVEGLLQAREAARLAPTPSHFGFDLTTKLVR